MGTGVGAAAAVAAVAAVAAGVWRRRSCIVDGRSSQSECECGSSSMARRRCARCSRSTATCGPLPCACVHIRGAHAASACAARTPKSAMYSAASHTAAGRPPPRMLPLSRALPPSRA
eukprot:833943-Prymnesium_polylepis.1